MNVAVKILAIKVLFDKNCLRRYKQYDLIPDTINC
jgi:hypothetical protein